MPGEESVKRFERSDGLDTALYNNIHLRFTGKRERPTLIGV